MRFFGRGDEHSRPLKNEGFEKETMEVLRKKNGGLTHKRCRFCQQICLFLTKRWDLETYV